MAHLSSFGVGNFKSFKDTYNFEFKPITILTGTNSSGKSSLTKAVLILKNNFSKVAINRNPNNLHAIDKITFDSALNLGNIPNLLNKKSRRKELIFEFDSDFQSSSLKLQFVYIPNESDSQQKEIELDSFKIYSSKNNDDILFSFNRGVINVNFSRFYDLYIETENLKISHVFNYYIDYLPQEDFEHYCKCIYEFSKGRIDNPYSNIESVRKHVRENDSENNLILKKLYNKLWSDKYPTFELFNSKIIELKSALEDYALTKEKTIYSFLLNAELEVLNKIKFCSKTKRYGNGSRYDVGEVETAFNEFSGFIDEKFMAHDKWDITQLTNINGTVLNELSKHLKGKGLDSNLLVVDGIILEGILIDGKLYHHIRQWESFLKDFVLEGIKNSFDNITESYNNMDFLPSVRTNVERRYKMGSNDSVMHKTLDNLFKNKYDVFNSRHFIDKYVKEFGIADKIEFELSSDSYDCRIKIIKDNKELDLADIGYGLSQVLPIIINIGIKTLQDDIDGLEGNKHEERILIIEEPETNLHPALQSKLADMFVECYKEYNIQLIIETHSEYLIRRLQYLTAKKEINPDFTQIYYFHPPDNVPKGETQIKKINLLKDGRLSTEFGSGFFDESTKIMESIWEARNLN